jgi:hypothetical protein
MLYEIIITDKNGKKLAHSDILETEDFHYNVEFLVNDIMREYKKNGYISFAIAGGAVGAMTIIMSDILESCIITVNEIYSIK